MAILLDPGFWSHPSQTIILGGQRIRHFDLWAAVWIASWVIPILASWMLTQQVNTSLPVSLYRNQIRYWLLMLGLFSLAATWHPSANPANHLAGDGRTGRILANLVGTLSLTQRQLPDLQIVTRQIVYRLSGTLVVFALAWLALTLILRSVTNLPGNTDPNLILILAAAVFAVLLMIVYRLVNNLARRLFAFCFPPGSDCGF
ncbi:hypothetical protein [Candidatus Amarobacter glycogenicus]|uniref:hypothetical protein n=1 Tax=Candidatus Amarobacter glycogenicus TaxID=3140699 RepID=UPI002A0FFD85|nr:hypothetical protein [Dehalococcoidia bacterium]